MDRMPLLPTAKAEKLRIVPLRLENPRRWQRVVGTGVTLLSFTCQAAHGFTVPTAANSRSRRPEPGRTHPSSSQRLHMMIQPDLHSLSEVVHHGMTSSSHILSESQQLLAAAPQKILSLPFEDMGKDLFDSLNVGKAIGRNVGTIPDKTISIVLDSLGRDILVFLTASVVVTLLSKAWNITPILGYLAAGALLGPHALDIFANTKADVELGDFGILFLLFSEGLEVSSARLTQLTRYLPLGFAQISLCTGVITAAILGGFPELLRELSIPIQATFIQEINPVEAVIVAIAGTLSTSAFVFPVLKERGWEEEPSGEAATSVLLLQDLMVAPLLVLLPYLVGQDATDFTAIGFLTAKAVLGFGATLYVGRYVIAKLFDWVSKANSAETFVALCLLVSAGMGTIAKSLGLTDTAGAFAAGVLLANTGFRAQIQADILPFKGILLGVFFMDAGSTFDIELALAAWPTILAGVVTLISLKAATMALATRVPEWMEPNRLPRAEGIKLSILLAGGGEFAFVVLALAERLGVISPDLSGVLTAIILITMGLTPLLGDFAATAAERILLEDANENEDCECRPWTETGVVPSQPIVVCGYGDVGHAVLHSLAEANDVLMLASSGNAEVANGEDNTLPTCETPFIVAFDNDPKLLEKSVLVEDDTAVLMFGDGSNPAVIEASGIEQPQAIFVCYDEHNNNLAATSRLSRGFPSAPIYVRAQTRKEAESLKLAGATEAVVESDELARSAVALMRTSYITNVPVFDKSLGLKKQLRRLAAAEAGISVDDVDCLLETYESLDQDGNGVQVDEVVAFLRRTNTGLRNDEDTKRVEAWFDASGLSGSISSLEFFQLYGRAPDYVQQAFACGKVQQKVQ
ncbi:regulated potassium-efflux system protein [Seminavis robusta]|uniref:Regulated potassium-efflux system protein n=1 Tax=Seminavis robusta TaxID=568900 RepID=A0A9N8HEQ0_9STRA|nr:regulated potassium-efflux system protein [Seminavis robusta]|eukprot:Sro314_g115000.1 regulated potassium-efflux system protein (863) ;mRNA; f:10969-13557